MKLTKTVADAAKYRPGGDTNERFVLWDDAVPGFGLRVNPGGTKTFVLSYRARGKSRLMTLGRYGPLTVQQARKRAEDRLRDVSGGSDPVRERQSDAKAETVADLAQLYMDRHAIPRKKPKSIEEDRRMLKLHVLPALGKLKADQVIRADVEKLHHRMRSTRYAANRVLSLLSTMFGLAEKWGVRPDGTNPTRHVDRYPEKSRERFLSASELDTLGQTLRDDERASRESQSAIDAIRLLILTGCRRNEITTLRWCDVDLDRARLSLPDSKTGAKLVTLAAPALELLAKLRERATPGHPFVIEGRKAMEHLTDLERPWRRVRARAGLDDVRLHDLRHSFASVAAGAGMSLPMIGKLLGHRQASTTARYAHLADDPVRAAADEIGVRIQSALEGAKQEAEVVPMPRRR